MALETHPQFKKIVDAMLSGENDRQISDWSRPRVSHTTIWRYRREKLLPAIAGPASVVKSLEEQGLLRPEQSADISAEIVKGVTRSALLDDPITSRIRAKYERFDSSLSSALKEKDLQALAQLENAETRALQLDATLRQVGGFSAASQAGGTTTIVLMPLPAGQPALPQAEVIDASPLPQIEPPE